MGREREWIMCTRAVVLGGKDQHILPRAAFQKRPLIGFHLSQCCRRICLNSAEAAALRRVDSSHELCRLSHILVPFALR
jgi:hypothetical protein